MNTETFSVRLDRSAKARLQKLAKSTGRSRAFLAAEAIVAYLDTNEWQVTGGAVEANPGQNLSLLITARVVVCDPSIPPPPIP